MACLCWEQQNWLFDWIPAWVFLSAWVSVLEGCGGFFSLSCLHLASWTPPPPSSCHVACHTASPLPPHTHTCTQTLIHSGMCGSNNCILISSYINIKLELHISKLLLTSPPSKEYKLNWSALSLMSLFMLFLKIVVNDHFVFEYVLLRNKYAYKHILLSAVYMMNPDVTELFPSWTP